MSARAWLTSYVIGCSVGVFLSGILTMQAYFYSCLFPKDRRFFKCLVAFIWIVDMLHTFMVCTANWHNIVVQAYHGDDLRSLDTVHWTIAGSMVLTAVSIWTVESFFIYKLALLSKRNLLLILPMVVASFGCVVPVFIAAAELVKCGSYMRFSQDYAYLITVTLSGTVALDMCITLGLMHYLRLSKNQFSSTTELLDTLIRYTMQTGAATCLMSIVALIVSVSMRHNLVFIGVAVPLSKVYANSFMALMNSRVIIRSSKGASVNTSDAPPSPSDSVRRWTLLKGDHSTPSSPELVNVRTSMHTHHDPEKGVDEQDRQARTSLGPSVRRIERTASRHGVLCLSLPSFAARGSQPIGASTDLVVDCLPHIGESIRKGS